MDKEVKTTRPQLFEVELPPEVQLPKIKINIS